MSIDKFELLRYIQRNSPIHFDALNGPFSPKPELASSLMILVDEKFVSYDRGIYSITEKGISKLTGMDEDLERERSLGKNQMDLVKKQKDFIDTQLRDYPLFKKLSIWAFIISIISILGILTDIIIKLLTRN
jgi:hypothetical protein